MSLWTNVIFWLDRILHGFLIKDKHNKKINDIYIKCYNLDFIIKHQIVSHVFRYSSKYIL